MAGKRKKIYGINGKYKPKHPRVGSWNLQDGRTGFTINSDDAVKQYNGTWVYPKFYRKRHPHDYWPSIPEEQGVGASGNNLGTTPAATLQCVLRDSGGNVIGVYESTNQFTCELASSAQVAAYQPTIADQSFNFDRFSLADFASVGTVVASDPNGLDLTYRISTNAGLGDDLLDTETFIIDSNTGELFVKTSENITDTITSLSIVVEVRNSQNLSNSATITIDIVDTYSNLIISYEPAAFYELSETSGSTILDTSGNGNNGQHLNSSDTGATSTIDDSQLAPGLTGNSPVYQSKDVIMANTSDIVRSAVSGNASLEATTGLTVIAWADPAENSLNVNRVQGTMVSMYAPSTNVKYAMYLEWLGGADSRFRVLLGDPADSTSVAWIGQSAASLSTPQEAKMYAFTFNEGVVKLFINGSVISQSTVSGSIPTSLPDNGGSLQFNIGTNAAKGDPYFGNLQAVSQFNTALTEAQIALLYSLATS